MKKWRRKMKNKRAKTTEKSWGLFFILFYFFIFCFSLLGNHWNFGIFYQEKSEKVTLPPEKFPCYARGGVHGTPMKTTFPAEVCDGCYTIHSFTKKNHIQANPKTDLPKWRPNYRFLLYVISISAKICKTTFQRNFFNEIWFIIGDYEYIFTLLK